MLIVQKKVISSKPKTKKKNVVISARANTHKNKDTSSTANNYNKNGNNTKSSSADLKRYLELPPSCMSSVDDGEPATKRQRVSLIVFLWFFFSFLAIFYLFAVLC